ncbi:MAG: YceI family protein [Nonlabens sp.]
MKKLTTILLCFLVSGTILQAQEKLNINTETSTIKWYGYYTFYFGGHEGFIDFDNGFLVKSNGKISGGEFKININSITSTDLEKGSTGNINLVDHLKNEDFFEVQEFPYAYLKITKVDYHDKVSARIEADFTIKGITKPINFQATFDYDKKEMKTRFKIDRQDWGIDYKSKFKDSAISDAVGFEVTIKL